MRSSLAFSISLLLVSQANAHCYSVWKYPYPQHCGLSNRGTDPNDNSWYVEITKLPPSWIDERAEGIEKLKEQLK